MAFIRRKGRNFYVVENRRVSEPDGKSKVKQTIVACLGAYPSVAVAIEKRKEQAADFEHYGKQFIEETAKEQPRHERYWQRTGEEYLRWAVQEHTEIERLEKYKGVLCEDNFIEALAAALKQNAEDEKRTADAMRDFAATLGKNEPEYGQEYCGA